MDEEVLAILAMLRSWKDIARESPLQFSWRKTLFRVQKVHNIPRVFFKDKSLREWVDISFLVFPEEKAMNVEGQG